MILCCNRFLQRWAPKSSAHSLFSFAQVKKMLNRSRGQNSQQSWFDVGIVFHAWQRQLPCGRSMNGKVKDCQSNRVLRLRVYSQQDLIGQLISGRGRRLTKRNIQNVALRVVGNTNRFHKHSLLSLPNLVRGHDEVVLRSVSIKAETDHDNYTGVSMRKVWVDLMIQVHLGADRVLEPSAFPHCFQHLPLVAPHFRVFLTNMTPALVRQINLMAQPVFDNLTHRSNSAVLHHDCIFTHKCSQ